MEFKRENAIEAYRRCVVFTDTLGKRVITGGLAHPGSIVVFTNEATYADPEYSYNWLAPTSQLPTDLEQIIGISRPIDSCSFLLMLTSKEHYVAANSAERTLKAKLIMAA